MNSCTSQRRHGRITHQPDDAPYGGFVPDLPCYPPDVVADVMVSPSAVHSSGLFFTREPNCRRMQPTDCSQLVLQTNDDCCHKLLSMNLSTSLQLTQLSRDHWRVTQPCRRFCDAVHVPRQLSHHALRLTVSWRTPHAITWTFLDAHA